MNYENILKSLQSDRFTEVIDTGSNFEKGATIYAKEIRQNVFLLFVVIKRIRIKNIHVFIASFDRLESIGIKEPLQTMFYLSITKNEDFHYFKKYIKVSQ